MNPLYPALQRHAAAHSKVSRTSFSHLRYNGTGPLMPFQMTSGGGQYVRVLAAAGYCVKRMQDSNPPSLTSIC